MAQTDPVLAARRSVARRWLMRLAVAALVIEGAWLTGINLALNLPATQAWLNSLRPEKFNVAWQSAWSWYPGQVQVNGASVSGQSRRIQYQAEAERVRARLAILPLLQHRVEITHASVENGRYLQRPRLEPDKDYSAALPWFPEIRGYPVAAVSEHPPSNRRPWLVIVKDARVTGPQTVWIGRLHAQFEASVEARLDVRSRVGPLNLDVGRIKLALQRVWADDGREILSGGAASGTLHLGPYRWRENRGLKAVRFLDLDLNLGLQSDSLKFVQLFLLKYPTLKTSGKGMANGRVVIRDGIVAPGTDLRVDASELAVADPPFAVEGHGGVSLSAGGQAPLPFTVTFHFDDLSVLDLSDRSPFLAGRDLNLILEDTGDLVPHDAAGAEAPQPFRATMKVANAALDMRMFNGYLPPNSPLTFTSGNADFTADIALTPANASGGFTLWGKDLSVRLDEQDLGLDLRFDGVVAGGTPPERRFDLAGSKLTLNRAWVLGEESQFDESDWSATVTMNKVDLVLQRPVDLDLAADLSMSDTRPLAALFRNHGGPKWIARRMTVEDLAGAASLLLRDNQIYVPDAHLGADQLEVGMKGIIREPESHGMYYLRYRRLDALLNFNGDKRDMVLIGSRKKFDAFQVPLPASP